LFAVTKSGWDERKESFLWFTQHLVFPYQKNKHPFFTLHIQRVSVVAVFNLITTFSTILPGVPERVFLV
jgi:hypothetical protein